MLTEIDDLEFAKVTLNLYDTFDPYRPGHFFTQRLVSPEDDIVALCWVPQTICDQVWAFVAFEAIEDRDAYMIRAKEVIREHVTGFRGTCPVSSKVTIPDIEEVKYWCPRRIP